jgi:hypothetical protein
MVIVLGLAILAAFWSQSAWPIYRLGDRDHYGSFDSQPKGWLWWVSDEGDDGHGHVPAYAREPVNGDDTVID